MARRRLPASRQTGRAAGFVQPRATILIVCEGKTEARLLSDLRARWRIASAKIHLVAQAGVPSTVVNRAKSLMVSERPDEGWVVFDRDEHPCWTQAIDEARRAGLGLAISNPCFEQWGILLHEEQNADLHRSEVQRRLSTLHPGYHHDRHPFLDADIAIRLLDDAERRAAMLDRIARELGEPHRAPTTTFPALVALLRSLAR